MTDSTIAKLQQGVKTLRGERDNLLDEIREEHRTMSQVEKKYEDLKLKYEYNNNAFKEKQQILAEYEKMIEEAKNAYKKLVDGSNKLHKAVQNETNTLKQKIEKEKAFSAAKPK